MKRTYKPLSLVYLIVTSTLVFQGSIKAEGPEVVETGRPTEVIPVETEVQKQEEQKKEQEEAAEEKQGVSGTGETEAGGTIQEGEGAPSLITQEEEKTTVSLGDVAKRYIQQAQEKGISIASSLVSKARDTLNTLRTQVRTAYNQLRSAIPLTYRLASGQKEAFQDISNQVAGISSFVDTTLRDVENFNIVDQSAMNEKLEQLSSLTDNLLTASRNLIESSDPNNADAQELNNRVKTAVIQALFDVRTAIRALSDPSEAEQTALLLARVGKTAGAIRNLSPKIVA